MEKQTFVVPNISCGHCVMSIKNELNEIDGVKSVEGDPDTKSITVEWESHTSANAIKEKLQEINYPAE
ncbi:MAG: heavy-metal-associated domain-containing protein [Deltaproteobacteria bacterium]|jgi:copper chaperone CopZ|nr:heavy-metal-associated domain-containing protein [Deltaproteobacteria bacterium]